MPRLLVTSIKVEEELWRKFKAYCVMRGEKVYRVLEELIREKLEKENIEL